MGDLAALSLTLLVLAGLLWALVRVTRWVDGQEDLDHPGHRCAGEDCWVCGGRGHR